MRLAALVVLFVCACDGVEEPPQNAEPIARVVVPQLWPAGEPALIDPTLSEDPDGDALSFSATFGDGTAQAVGDDVFEHVYGTPGSFAVEIIATDGEAETRVESRVVVVGDDAEACSCETPCLEDGICVEGACVLF
jgi:hypothetical protein